MRPTTTISDIRTVSVPVTDQDAALDFYVNTLGFERRLDVTTGAAGRWVEVAPRGSTASIALAAASNAGGDGDARRLAFDTGIRFAVADAAAEHEALCARNVSVGELLQWPGVPPMFTFDDPDGNRFYVVENGR